MTLGRRDKDWVLRVMRGDRVSADIHSYQKMIPDVFDKDDSENEILWKLVLNLYDRVRSLENERYDD